jgi:hypothetical protein
MRSMVNTRRSTRVRFPVQNNRECR